MNLFQFLAIGSLAVVMLDDLVRLLQGRIAAGAGWCGPQSGWPHRGDRPSAILQSIANLLGIGRGTDVLLYLLVFVFLGTSFFLYSRTIVFSGR